MKKVLSLGAIAVLAGFLLAGAGCSKQQIDSRSSESRSAATLDDDFDSSLRVLTGEALRAAEELANGTVYFEFNKYDIQPESRLLLTRKAELLKQYPQIRASIQGHCDDRGTEEYNLALGERRAQAAFDFLVMSGVNASQLEVVSYGKLRPAVQGQGEAVWSLNRRDEFIVLIAQQER